jgi:enoyl-CoA hydratase
MNAAEILFERRGAAGIITLNRPKALNAVTHGMVRAMAAHLEDWAQEPAVTRVVITAAGDRAFSAGGDIRDLYELGRAGRHDQQLAFWRDEYPLNVAIKRYPKPFVALIDGLVMGGGVGVSVHGSHRVAGDRFQFAMPEVGIGFFPDVGATWFLPRLPGELGTWCALTGARLGADDGVSVGIATHRVPSARLRELTEALCGAAPVDSVLVEFGTAPGAGPMQPLRPVIDRLFTGKRVEDILTALAQAATSDAAHSAWIGQTAATIGTKSPTSLKIALAQIRLGPSLSFEDCMRHEFRIVSRVVRGHDFYEGVRAAVIDKDNSPHWQPQSLAGVSEADVARYFAPLGPDDLTLP